MFSYCNVHIILQSTKLHRMWSCPSRKGGTLYNRKPQETAASAKLLDKLSPVITTVLKKRVVPAQTAHILNLEGSRGDYHSPCAKMTHKFVKCSTFFEACRLVVSEQARGGMWSTARETRSVILWWLCMAPVGHWECPRRVCDCLATVLYTWSWYEMILNIKYN